MQFDEQAVEAVARAIDGLIKHVLRQSRAPSIVLMPAPDDLARAALTTLEPYLAVPEGWVLVPREATEEMTEAAASWSLESSIAKRAIYRAMIASAPPAPSQGGKP